MLHNFLWGGGLKEIEMDYGKKKVWPSLSIISPQPKTHSMTGVKMSRVEGAKKSF